MDYSREILERFQTISSQGRMAHAYLFIGPAFSGKSTTVNAIARMLNCEQPGGQFFCGQCASCRKIESGNHPDIYRLETGLGETIKIEDIRAFIQRCTLRSFEAKWKVFTITNAERLTKEAANALLKTLEEPHKQTLIFLTTSVAELCLDTIKSRCHAIHFFPMSLRRLTQMMIDNYSLDEVSAQSLAFFADGSYQRAKNLHESKFHLQKNKMIDEMVMRRSSDEFIRKTLSDKEHTKTLLDVLLSFFRDMALLKSGVDESFLANRDRVRDLKSLSNGFTFDHVMKIVDEIINAMRLFKDNLNVKMSMSVIKELVWVK
ncbi:MAG: DNA polymerase III subunit delta' [Candidatus Omnitrophica bacterium]|nr:DNA polymerase III subunit delta' [Candidatus Omnitrophota bacterium]